MFPLHAYMYRVCFISTTPPFEPQPAWFGTAPLVPRLTRQLYVQLDTIPEACAADRHTSVGLAATLRADMTRSGNTVFTILAFGRFGHRACLADIRVLILLKPSECRTGML